MSNYDKMWKMLERFKFEIDPQALIHLTCIICQNLLIDAYQGVCGCNYCKKCIDKYLSDGRSTCPCESKDYNNANNLLNDITKDNSANKRVSKLLVKCPSNICEFTCEMIQMSSHLEICDNISKTCPFREIGCTINTMDRDEIRNHLIQELLPHNLLITEWMTNTKNELTADIPRHVHRIKLEDIEKMIQLKLNETTSVVQNQRTSVEGVNNDLLKEIANIKRKNEELKLLIHEITDKFNKEIDALKVDKIDLAKQILDEKENMKTFFENSLEGGGGFKCYCKGQIATTKGFVDAIDLSRKTSCETLSNSAVKYGDLVWNLNNLSEMSGKPWGIPSERFYSNDQCYEMRLRLWEAGCHKSHKSTHICIEYTVTNAGSNDESHWPITCQVLITIKVKDASSELKVLKLQKCLEFKEPNYDFELFSPSSSQFHFLISDLKQSGVIYESLFIECHAGFIS